MVTLNVSDKDTKVTHVGGNPQGVKLYHSMPCTYSLVYNSSLEDMYEKL